MVAVLPLSPLLPALGGTDPVPRVTGGVVAVLPLGPLLPTLGGADPVPWVAGGVVAVLLPLGPLLPALGGTVPVPRVAGMLIAPWLQFAQPSPPPPPTPQRLQSRGVAEAGARAGVRGLSQASLSNVKAIKATSSVRSGRASGSGAAATTHLTGAQLHRGCAGRTRPCPVGQGCVHLEWAKSRHCHPPGVPAAWTHVLTWKPPEARCGNCGFPGSLWCQVRQGSPQPPPLEP